jgi:hypothetical protein
MTLSWTLTVLFAATGAWFLAGCTRADRTTDRISCGAHVVMGVAMIAMAWPWGMAVPMWPQVAFFATATLWFAGLATVPHRPHGFPALHNAMMAAAMVWMVGTMAMPGHGGHRFVIVTGALAWYFVLAAGPLLYNAVRKSPRAIDAAGHAAMSVGTGVLLLSMV